MPAESLPDAAKGITFDPEDHTYRYNGRRVPSVTQVIGNLSKPALVFWSANMAAAAVREWWEDRAVPKPGNDRGRYVGVDELDIDELHTLAKRAHIDRKNKAAAKGSVVHDAIERFHTDFFSAEAPEDPEAAQAWRAFVEWWGRSGLTCEATELVIKDPAARYSGRLDLLAAHRETAKRYVLDVKTSGGFYTEFLLQLAAYAEAYEAETGVEIDGTRVLWLPAGASKLTVIERSREEWKADFAIFEPLLELNAYRKRMDKWAKAVTDEHKPKPEEENA